MAYHSYIVLRGEYSGKLLGKSRDGRYEEHSHRFIFGTPDIYSFPDEAVAPLTEEVCVLLDVIHSLETRFAVYSSPGKLKWGLGLKVGDTVLARLPDKSDGRGSSGSEQYATAIIRWRGLVNLSNGLFLGHRIGVEITEPLYHGYGDSDGTYHGEIWEDRYFTCEKNCGLFLTLAELEKPPSSNGASSVATQEHTSQLERELAAKTQETHHLQQQLSSTERRLQEQGRQMAALQGEVGERTETVARLQGEVREKTEIVAGLQGEVRRERETVAGLQGEVRREKETVTRLQGEVREKTEMVARLEDELIRREGKLKVDEDQVADLLSANREKLKIAVTLDMTWLADKMHGAGLLPDNVHKDVTNARSVLTEDQKATEIIGALEKLVSINPRNYQKFVDVLEKKPIYSDVTKLMKQQ